MLRDIEKKADFIEEVEKKYTELRASYQHLSKRKNSDNGKMKVDVSTKFKTLEKSLSALSWKIDNFKNSQLDLGRTVKNSFSELIDEIEWRIKEVEMALHGKEVWDRAESGKSVFK